MDKTELHIIISDEYYMTYLVGEYYHCGNKMYENPFYRMFESTLLSEYDTDTLKEDCHNKGIKNWWYSDRENLIGFSEQFSKVCSNVKIATILEIMTLRAEDGIPAMFLDIFEYNKANRIIQELLK